MAPIARRYDPSPIVDLTQLRYVRAIVACGNMTAAAKQLGVSQPSLSNAIARLEARLGTSLFLRDARGVIPTAAATILARVAEESFGLLRQAGDEIRGIESAPVGRYSIGCHHSFGGILLPSLITALAESAPGIELTFWEGIGPTVVDAVIDRTVQFGVGVRSACDADLHPELVVVPLFRDVMAVVRRKGHMQADAPLFHVPRVRLSQMVFEGLRNKRALPPRVVPCGDLDLVMSFVESGAGIGILPWRVAVRGRSPGAIELVDSSLPFEPDTGCLFYRADLPLTRSARAVRDQAVRCGRQVDAAELPCKVPRIDRKRR